VKGGVIKIHWGVILGSGTSGTEVLEFYYNNFIMKLLLFSLLSDFYENYTLLTKFTSMIFLFHFFLISFGPYPEPLPHTD
jgi:uncharacterized membrane protein